MHAIKSLKHMALLLTVILIVAGCQGNTVSDGDEAKDTQNTQETQNTEDTQDSDDTASNQDGEGVKDSQNQDAESEEGYTFTDVYGHTITLDDVATRYISFSPEITEILYAIGAGDGLVGRSVHGTYPEAALEVEELGSLSDYNMERVVELDPDVVFISSLASEENYQQFVDAGITPIAVSYGKTLVGTMDYVEQIAEITGHEEEAKSVITSIDEAIKGAKERAANRESKSVYYVLGAGEGGDYAATGDTFISQIIELVGGTNIAADGSNWVYNVEQVVEKDPDFIIGTNDYGVLDSLLELDGYKDLTAVKEGRVYDVNPDIFDRQGPRVVEAIEQMESILYGDE